LSVPVLAGSAAYALGEARRWPIGLARLPLEARAFYATLVFATLLGVAINFSPVNPIRALYWSAVINGLVAVPVMIVMMLMTANRRIMGKFKVVGRLRTIGWTATAAMAAAAVGMCVTTIG
jgi:Mn2+/Fe2+ NRAMP family transporter